MTRKMGENAKNGKKVIGTGRAEEKVPSDTTGRAYMYYSAGGMWMLLINKPLERLYLHIISSEPKQSDKSDKYFCILRQALYILHFLLTGKNSERSNGPVFDSRWALQQHPEVP